MCEARFALADMPSIAPGMSTGAAFFYTHFEKRSSFPSDANSLRRQSDVGHRFAGGLALRLISALPQLYLDLDSYLDGRIDSMQQPGEAIDCVSCEPAISDAGEFSTRKCLMPVRPRIAVPHFSAIDLVMLAAKIIRALSISAVQSSRSASASQVQSRSLKALRDGIAADASLTLSTRLCRTPSEGLANHAMKTSTTRTPETDRSNSKRLPGVAFVCGEPAQN
jgi:hypothetical protein